MFGKLTKWYKKIGYGKQLIVYLIILVPLTLLIMILYHVFKYIGMESIGIIIFTIYYGSFMWYGAYLNGKWANSIMKKYIIEEQEKKCLENP